MGLVILFMLAVLVFFVLGIVFLGTRRWVWGGVFLALTFVTALPLLITFVSTLGYEASH